MAILKSEIKNKYSQIPNSVIHDKDLSDGDYRLLILLYSFPNNWKINQDYLAQKVKCNRRNVNSKLKRIKEAGYLEIQKNINKKKKEVDFIYVLKEKDIMSVNDVSVGDYTSVGDVSVGDTYNNTNINNTNNINNELNNIIITPQTKSKKFTKPSLEEINNFILENNLKVNGEHFYDYYESNGWKVGKNSMKDWKATLRNWNRNNFNEKSKRSNKTKNEEQWEYLKELYEKENSENEYKGNFDIDSDF